MDILPEHAQIIEKLNEEFSDIQDENNAFVNENNALVNIVATLMYNRVRIAESHSNIFEFDLSNDYTSSTLVDHCSFNLNDDFIFGGCRKYKRFHPRLFSEHHHGGRGNPVNLGTSKDKIIVKLIQIIIDHNKNLLKFIIKYDQCNCVIFIDIHDKDNLIIRNVCVLQPEDDDCEKEAYFIYYKEFKLICPDSKKTILNCDCILCSHIKKVYDMKDDY